MPQIKVEEANSKSKSENQDIRREAWIKTLPVSEPAVLFDIGLPDDENDSSKDYIPAVTLGVSAYSFADNFTMHGVRHAFARDASKIKRLIWFSMVIVALSYCGYVMYETFQSYLKYPTTTSVRTKFEDKSPFPAVTICNFNAFQDYFISGVILRQNVAAPLFAVFTSSMPISIPRRTRLSVKEQEAILKAFGGNFGLKQFFEYFYYDGESFSLKSIETTNEETSDNLQTRKKTFVSDDGIGSDDKNWQNVNEFHKKSVLNNYETNNESLNQNDEGLSANFNDSSLDSIDVLELFFNKSIPYIYHMCLYKGEPCRSEFFSKVLTDFGLCLKFDPSVDSSSAFQTSAVSDGGLFLAMEYNPSEWSLGPNYYGEGFRVILHEPGTTRSKVCCQGVSLKRGFLSEIGFTRKEENFLGPPYGNCGGFPLAYSSSYSELSCLLECETNQTVSKCGCKYAYMPGPDRVCNFREYGVCQKQSPEYEILTKTFKPYTCTCLPDCKKTSYETSITETTPAAAFKEALRLGLGYNFDENGIAVQIYYKDFQIETHQEEPEYTIEKLLSDIGGAAGLFLGCSFLTFMELFNFLGDMFWLVIAGRVLSTAKKRQENKKMLSTIS